ncbi:helix-turn-helix domain-containing protein [Paenibacillus vietnamensis]|uniref:helix-turn-helix domain-containing protein n=1 Tax=Paenibacillus vietnamensis TaxID=2590547 RepID=UPI001CD0E62B|nr:helix-turn-helix domain-containing protein [Paenibacillus vietnamensis]
MLNAMKKAVLQWRKEKPGTKGKFYRKSLVTLLIVSSIPGLITGMLVYSMAGGKLEKELLQLHKSQIEQRARNIDSQLTNLELMLSHWAFDSKFDYSLGNRDFKKDFPIAHDITKTLLVMQGSNTMNKVVGLYVKGGPSVLFEPEYGTIASQEEQAVYEGLLQPGQMTYWTKAAFDPSRPQEKELTLVHQVPGGSLQPFGVLFIRLDNERVGDMLRTMTPYDGGETFFMQDGGALFASTNGKGADSTFTADLREKIAGREANAGSFFFEYDGVTYTVTYGKFSRIADSWTYVTASPISSITAPVVFISKIIFGVSLSALLVAALLAWFASQRIYSPIGRLMTVLMADKSYEEAKEDEFTLIERQWHHLNRESSELHTKLTEQLPYVNESFLHQLLQGYLYAYSEEELLSRMERYKWKVTGQRFTVLYMQLTGMTSLEGKFKYGDEGLVTFAAVNMIEEFAGKHFEQSQTINFHDLSAGLLIAAPDDGSGNEALEAFGEELTLAVNLILKMKLTIAVGEPTASISQIPLSFEEAKHAANQREFGNENQWIDIGRLHSAGEGADEPQYPFTLERELLQALRTGQESTAYELLQAFLEALSCKGAKAVDVQQGMLHLLGSVQHAMMVSGIQPTRLFKCVNMYEQLSQIREPELILVWFRERVCEPFLQELGARSDTGAKRLIEQAMIYLQQHYMNDISLDHCADHIGTNPFYLSKTFKQVTGKNFIDYLTGIRMDKAKELLRESTMKINDVAEQVGYQHSYFNRIFKKLEGMTPTRYRELSQAD